MADLFPAARFRHYAPAKPRRAALPPAPVRRFPSGLVCDARCMFGIGPDCDCACGGLHHGAGLRADLVTQEGFAL